MPSLYRPDKYFNLHLWKSKSKHGSRNQFVYFPSHQNHGVAGSQRGSRRKTWHHQPHHPLFPSRTCRWPTCPHQRAGEGSWNQHLWPRPRLAFSPHWFPIALTLVTKRTYLVAIAPAQPLGLDITTSLALCDFQSFVLHVPPVPEALAHAGLSVCDLTCTCSTICSHYVHWCHYSISACLSCQAVD